MTVTLALVARVPRAGLADFRAYEDAVLPLLERHGGQLERRLRSMDGLTELHVVAFPSREAVESYRADPERAAHQDLLQRSGAATEVLEVTDV